MNGGSHGRLTSRARIPLGAFWLVLVLVLAQMACGAAEDREAPNVILVSVDTLRADALGSYGSPYPTPALDGLAAEGVLFERAYAPAALTAPSHVSLLTGRDPLQHRVIRNGLVLPGELEFIAERFTSAGYASAGFVSSFVLDVRFGWNQGFAVYDSHFPEEGATVPKERGTPGMFFLKHDFGGFDRRADVAVDAALAWLEDAPEPYFLFVHLVRPPRSVRAAGRLRRAGSATATRTRGAKRSGRTQPESVAPAGSSAITPRWRSPTIRSAVCWKEPTPRAGGDASPP